VCGWGWAWQGVGLGARCWSQTLPIPGLSVAENSCPQDPAQESPPPSPQELLFLSLLAETLLGDTKHRTKLKGG